MLGLFSDNTELNDTVKMSRRTSLKDIAEKVGVSIALVSYVINGQEKEKRVGKEVRYNHGRIDTEKAMIKLAVGKRKLMPYCLQPMH